MSKKRQIGIVIMYDFPMLYLIWNSWPCSLEKNTWISTDLQMLDLKCFKLDSGTKIMII